MKRPPSRTRKVSDGEPADAIIPIQVEIDQAVSGWAAGERFDIVLRGQITAWTPPESLSIRDPGGVELVSLQFGQNLDAVPVSLPDGATAFRTGFQIHLPVAGGDGVQITDLWVRARDQNGGVFEAAMRIGCNGGQAAILAGPVRDLSETQIPDPPSIVYLESAVLTASGLLRVEGWAVTGSPPVAVQIFTGDTQVGVAVHQRERGDVGDAYPAYPNSQNAGFMLECTPPSRPSAGSLVTAQVLCLNGSSLTVAIPLAVEPAPEVRSWDIGRAILLLCDRAVLIARNTLRVEGWAACGYGIERVLIEIDGNVEGEAGHGQPREDVAAE